MFQQRIGEKCVVIKNQVLKKDHDIFQALKSKGAKCAPCCFSNNNNNNNNHDTKNNYKCVWP